MPALQGTMIFRLLIAPSLFLCFFFVICPSQLQRHRPRLRPDWQRQNVRTLSFSRHNSNLTPRLQLHNGQRQLDLRQP
jgi:hypothetical protein